MSRRKRTSSGSTVGLELEEFERRIVPATSLFASPQLNAPIVGGSVSGRDAVIAFGQDNDGHPAAFLGTQTGGVFRSTDFTEAAPHWTALTDFVGPINAETGFGLGLTNVGDIAVDPNDPKHIFVGTGSMISGGTGGSGILESTDGGNSFAWIAGGSNGFRQAISRIVVDPDHPDVLYVAVAPSAFDKQPPLSEQDGIYKVQFDGATSTWTWVKKTNDDDLGIHIGAQISVTDLDYVKDGENFYLFAAVYGSGLFESDDFGETWSQIGFLLSATPGRIALASDHMSEVFAGFVASDGSDKGKLTDIYELYDRSPTSWSFDKLDAPVIDTQGGFDLAFRLAPSGLLYYAGTADRDHLEWGAVEYDPVSGSSVLIGNGPAPRPHQDMHALGFYGGKVYLGTDGGLFRYTPNPGRLGGWEDLNTTGLDTLQVNSVAARNGNLILDASQDNGHARTLDGADGHPPTWTSMGGGDGVGIWFDPDAAGHANMAYAANQHGEVYRTDNVTTVGAGGWEQIARRDVNNVDFYTPFAITPDAADTRIARAWNNWFIESRNRGAAGSWTVYPVFQEMNWLAAIPLLAPLASIKYMTYAPYEDGAGAVKWGRVAWVVFGNEVLGGGERGHIYRWQVVGAGGYWQRVTDIVYEGNKLQPAKLVPDPKTPGTMFAVMDSTSGPQVFWTRDFGKTWEDITGSGASALPNIGVTTLLVDPRRDKNANPLTAYAGTEVGVYKGVFQDDVWSWSVLDENLPKVRVSDLQITGGGQDILIVGTYGRGVWRIDLDAMCSFDSELEALTGQDQTVSATANVELEAGVVAIFTDPNNTDLDPDLYECAIDWGDGETSAGTVVVNEDDTFSVLGDHTYTNAGTFTVSVKIANNNDQTIFVDSTANVSGDIAAAAEPLESDEVAQLSDAVIASFTDTYTGAAPEDYTVSIDWGDGNSSSGSVVANESGGFDVVASHEYGEPAWFPITVTIDSVRDGHAVVLTQATIADATITGSAADDATADEDSATEFTLATFTDDNPDSVAGDFSASIDWGDGSDPDEGTITQQEDGSYVVTGTHTYAGPGDYEASVFTSDAGGSYANTTLTITVDGIAPEITGLEPDIGSTDGGRVVVITGSNLERVTDVYFGATAASDFSLQGSDRLIAVAPAHSSGTVHITVSNETGTSATSSADEFVFEEPPVNSVPSSQTTDEDTNLVFSSSAGNQVSVSDSDSSVIEVTLAVSHGALTLFSTGGLTFSAGDGYGDATMKFHGSPTWVNYALNGMTYAPAADYNGSDTLHVLSDDLAGGADSDTVGITVSAVNDAPVITAPSYVNAYQNTSNSLGGAFSIADVDAGGFSIQITLTVSAGTLTLSTTSGLTFSTGDGTDDATVTFTGTLAAINAALDGMNYNAINTWYETLTIEVNDLGNSGLGGELTDSALVGIMIGP